MEEALSQIFSQLQDVRLLPVSLLPRSPIQLKRQWKWNGKVPLILVNVTSLLTISASTVVLEVAPFL